MSCSQPEHPYTVGLLGSIPRIDRALERLATIEGMLPDMTGRRPAAASPRAARLSTDACVAAPPPSCGRRRPLVALHARAAAKGWCHDRAARGRWIWSKHFVARRSIFGRPTRIVNAVDGVNFTRRGRQDAGAGRRIRLRQVDRRPAGAAADRGGGRQNPVRGPRHLALNAEANCAPIAATRRSSSRTRTPRSIRA